jgi:predicted MPP superfamily phosphohydrolase
VIAKILETRYSSVITDTLNIIGGFWLAFMLYGFLLFLLSEIILIILKLTGSMGIEAISTYRKWSFIAVAGITFLLITAGFINALIPSVKNYDIEINKLAGETKTLKIAAASDIHLGSTIRKRSLRKLSSILNKEKPDLILLLGDIIDGEIGPVLRGDLLKYFDPPECKYGLYAVAGNHEYIGGGQRTIPYIESRGIRVLKDEIVTLSNGVQLIGRIDKDAGRFYGKPRLPLKTLIEQTDTTKPVILLDHQPFNIDETVKSNVDIQLSGHTHNGQMFPLNYITKKIFEVSYGHLKRENSNIIVTSGYGIWGPRVRLGSRSEVIIVNVRFGDSDGKN